MYIAPNTSIYIMKNVPLDKSYEHTLRFNTEAEQQWYFINQTNPKCPVKYVLNNQMYQRSEKGTLRVNIKAEDLYDCNYLAFRNTSFGNKIFYAFITKPAEMRSNTVAEITYEIDDMQTWYFDYTLGRCFVEREHTQTDMIGEHIVPEDLFCGEQIVTKKTTLSLLGKDFCGAGPRGEKSPLYWVYVFYVPNGGKVITTLVNPDEPNLLPTYSTNYIADEDARGEIRNGTYSGCSYTAFPFFTAQTTMSSRSQKAINDTINTIIKNKMEVAHIALVPDYIHRNNFKSGTVQEIPLQKGFTLYDDYIYRPKNNKLYTSPYCSIMVSNNAGKTAEYKWELFAYNEGKPVATFVIDCSSLYSAEAALIPTWYRWIDKDYESALLLNDFPTPSWSTDSFSKWWAQNKESYIISLVASTIQATTSIGVGIATGGASTAIQAAATAGTAIVGGTSAASGIANSIGSYVTAKNTPDQVAGQVVSSSLKKYQDRYGFTIYQMGIKGEMAKIIDDYFTMYGYKVNSLKDVNVRNPHAKLRPHWNYIKTQNCIIEPAHDKGLPSDAEEKIAKIYNNGITFWEKAEEVGNYNLDNSPTP